MSAAGKCTVAARDWVAVATYVQTYPADPHDGACDVVVQIGQGEDGSWYLRTSDDAGGSDDADDTAYRDEWAAATAADAYASDRDEGSCGEDAAGYLRRMTELRAGEPDADGEWCVYWSTALDDPGPRERYETREQAEAAAEIANEDLRQTHRGHLLCGCDVRQLVDGEWISLEEE